MLSSGSLIMKLTNEMKDPIKFSKVQIGPMNPSEAKVIPKNSECFKEFLNVFLGF